MGLCWILCSVWSPPLRWPPLKRFLMKLTQNKYYHFFNRSNNKETVFKSRDNYLYFLLKYRKYLGDYVVTVAYCLMPDHFHFLILIKTHDVVELKKNIGIFLSSYTKAINKANNRTGSLFQQHSKTKTIENEKYLLQAIAYIHQNPVRKNLVEKIEHWEFSSYRDYAEMRNGTLVNKEFLSQKFKNVDDFIFFSKQKTEKLNFIFDSKLY